MSTHPADAQPALSGRYKHDKYLKMQLLLQALADSCEVPQDFRNYARDLLEGMETPRTTEVRARERAEELEALRFAYQALKGVGNLGVASRAAAVTFEALKAWERAHPPAPLDPLLLP